MKIVFGLLCALSVSWTLADEGVSAEARAFLADWSAAMADVRSLRVRFKQTKTLRLLRKPRVSEGLTVLKGERLHMTVTRGGQPEIELAVGGGEARLYYPKRKTVEVYALDGGPPPESPFPLFSGDVAQLAETHALELTRTPGELDQLVMVPKDPESKTARVVMRFREFKVVEVEQTTRRGDTVKIEVSEFAVNAEVAEGELELELPDDVKVVEGVSGRGGKQ